MTHIPRKELRPSEKRYADGTTVPAWDISLDGALIASEYTSQAEARLELDLAAWYALFADAPLTPTIPITDEAISLAMQVFNRLFGAEKVQEKARIARDKIIGADIYTINADGSLSVMASSGKGAATYAVTALKTPAPPELEPAATYHVTMACECRDFYTRAHAHAGICKHVAARMLLHLAQRGVGFLKHLRDALDVVPSSLNRPADDASLAEPDEPPLAFVSLGATDLAAALFLLARAENPIEVRAERGQLRLLAGSIDVTYPGLDGGETATVRISAEALRALYDELRPLAPKLGSMTLFVAPSDGLLIVSADEGTFSHAIQGEAIPSEHSLGSSVPDTLSPAGTSTLDALFELFTLLETHEPAWYQRRHYRIAHDALHGAGRIV